jgi:hypothetical protein
MSRSLFGNRLYPVFGASAAESRRNERRPKIRRALSGVENHPDDGQTCVGVRRDWTSPKGVHQLNSACSSVPLLNDRTLPHRPEEAVPVARRP